VETVMEAAIDDAGDRAVEEVRDALRGLGG